MIAEAPAVKVRGRPKKELRPWRGVTLDGEVRLWVKELMEKHPGAWASERAALHELVRMGRITFAGPLAAPVSTSKEDPALDVQTEVPVPGKLVRKVREFLGAHPVLARKVSGYQSPAVWFDHSLRVQIQMTLGIAENRDVDDADLEDELGISGPLVRTTEEGVLVATADFARALRRFAEDHRWYARERESVDPAVFLKGSVEEQLRADAEFAREFEMEVRCDGCGKEMSAFDLTQHELDVPACWDAHERARAERIAKAHGGGSIRP